MTRSCPSLPVALLLACLPVFSHASVDCRIIGIDNFATAYDGQLPWTYRSSGTFTVSCTRTAANDPTTIGFQTTTDNGLNEQGQRNRAKFGSTGNTLFYDFYADAAYSINWSNKSASGIAGTINLGTGIPVTGTATMTYYSDVPSKQTGLAAGLYSDSVAVALKYGSPGSNQNTWTTVANAAQLAVSINNIPSCVLSTPPGTVSFNYTAFSPNVVTASPTTFAAMCSTNHPYTMALTDATGVVSGDGSQASGVLAGLRYTLTLSTSSGVGSGSAQFHTISGSMAAGQAGSCSAGVCTQTQQHQLIISY